MSNKDIPTLKIVLYGHNDVGKTSLTNRYVNNTFEDNVPATIGSDYNKKMIVIDQQTYKLQIWDTSGSDRFWPSFASLSRSTDACILMYSTTDQNSFDRLSSFKQRVSSYLPTVDGAFPLVVIGTKTDLISERAVQKETAHKWCTDNDIHYYFEVSAKDDLGVDEVVNHVARLALKHKNLKQVDLQRTSPVVLIDPTDDQPVQRGCC